MSNEIKYLSFLLICIIRITKKVYSGLPVILKQQVQILSGVRLITSNIQESGM